MNCATSLETRRPLTSEQVDKENCELSDGSQPVKLSHPSQFDQTKPFLYSGHVVYPLPAGLQPPPHALPVPLTVLGNPSFAHPIAVPPNFMPQHLPFPIRPLAPPHMFPPMSQQALTIPNFPPPALTPQLPSPDTMLDSEVTKLQIQGFYNHLKHVDNQIANNKHQIDECYMIYQRGEVLAAIARMETLLRAQLVHEGATGAKLTHVGNFDGASDNRANGISFGTSVKRSSENSSSRDEQISGGSRGIFSKPKLVSVTITAPSDARTPIGKIKVEQSKPTEDTRSVKPNTRMETQVKSKLSAAAAMAPPFQPRVRAINVLNTCTRYPSPDAELPTMQSQLPVDAQLHDPIFGDQSRSSSAVVASGYLPPSSAHSVHETSTHSRENSSPSVFGGPLDSFNRQSINHPNAVPYLVGILPLGVDAAEAKGKDILYSRPLKRGGDSC